jgi:hypothetical protein
MVSLNEGLLLFGAATAVEAATPFMAIETGRLWSTVQSCYWAIKE